MTSSLMLQLLTRRRSTGESHNRGMFSSFISGFTYLGLDDFLGAEEKQKLLKDIDATDQTGWTQGCVVLPARQ